MKYIKLFNDYKVNEGYFDDIKHLPKDHHIRKDMPTNWILLSDKGSEAFVYTDGKYAYRVQSGSQFEFNDIHGRVKDFIGKDFKNVVKIFDMWFDNGYIFIKMELLKEVDPSKVSDQKEYHEIHDDVCMAEDEVNNLPEIISRIKNSELKKMVSAIYNAGKELGLETLDMGFHNLMYDPNTREYKQIDLF